MSPGALEFTQDGRELHLDTVLEQAGDQQLFIMFATTPPAGRRPTAGAASSTSPCRSRAARW